MILAGDDFNISICWPSDLVPFVCNFYYCWTIFFIKYCLNQTSATRVTVLASWGLPRDAEQFSRVTEFSIRTEQPLQQLHLSFNMCYFISVTLKYLYVRQEMFASAPIYDVDVETFGGKLTSKLASNVVYALTSCTRVVCRWHFLAPVSDATILSGMPESQFIITSRGICFFFIIFAFPSDCRRKSCIGALWFSRLFSCKESLMSPATLFK